MKLMPQQNPPEKFYGAFEDQDEVWGEIEDRLYASRLKPRKRDSRLLALDLEDLDSHR
jgi:hypothetical protein